MTALTLAKLAEIEAAAAKATPGPWYHVQPYMVVPKERTIHGPVPEQRVDFVSTTERPVHGPSIIPMPRHGEPSVLSDNMAYIALCNPATVAALCNAYRERDALAAQLTGYDAAREMLNVQDNKIDALRSALRIARETIYSLDAREIYDDELALIDAALAEGRS